jgi:hypothetical protein
LTASESWPGLDLRIEFAGQIGDHEGRPVNSWCLRAYGSGGLGGELRGFTAPALVALARLIARVVEVPIPRQIVEVNIVPRAPRRRRPVKLDPERAEIERIKKGLRR